MRTRTFLFSDLREYTAFIERHGDVAATTLIADFQRLVRAEIVGQGAEIKTEGDSFYAVFEGATEAVRCGVSILQQADRYSSGRPDRPMRVGIGIHTGEPQPLGDQFVGRAVVIAARLAQSANAGELLITDVVRGLLPRSERPPTTEREGIVMKGIEDPPPVFAVAWTPAEPAATAPLASPSAPTVLPPATPSERSMLCPRLIGRDVEFNALRALLGDVGAGRGRLGLLAGEAGVGKSAILRRFIEYAHGTGTRVLRGECTEIEARRPFGPIIDAFSAAGLPLPPALAAGAPGAMGLVEAERYRAHASIADALAAVADRTPLLIAIEDIHWADEATLELFPYLARKLRDRPVLVLGTYRDDELHRLHPLRGIIAALKRSRLVTEVRLAPLTEDEVAAMMQAILRLQQAPTTAWRQAIAERCEGNPFFIEEVLRTLVERGDLAYRDGAWRRAKEVSELAIPDSVREAVQQRLAAFAPSVRRALQVAAVVGQRFDFELVQQVAGILETELLAALREALDEQLIEEDEQKDDAYRFRHALTRESVLAELMRRERRQLHHEVGLAIEAATVDPTARAEELAYHTDLGGDEERAHRYHVLAADEAERVFAYARAAEHLERAIELAPSGDPVIGALQLRLARASFHGLHNARAARAADAARAAFHAADDTRHEGEALAELGLIRRRSGDSAAGNRDLEAGVALLEPLGPTRELATAYTRLASAVNLDERPDAVAIARRALDLATQVGTLETRVSAIGTLGYAIALTGDFDQGLRLLRKEIDQATEHGLAGIADSGYHQTGFLLRNGGAARAESEAVLEERSRRAQANGLRTDFLLWFLAIDAYERGDWDELLRLVEEGRGDAYFSVYREAIEAIVLTARVGPDAGVSRLDGFGPRWARLTSPQDVTARAYLTAVAASLVDNPRGALEAVAPAASLRTFLLVFDWVCVLALCAAQQVADARAAARWSEVGLSRQAHFGHGPAVASRAAAEGVRAALAGDRERALERYLVAARALEDDRGHHVSTALRKVRAEMLVQRGDREAAAAELESVLPFWRKARAEWYLGQLRAWAGERGIPFGGEPSAARI